MVEETLAGRSDRIKSYTVAVDVFGRGDGFDATTDPIVRIEASRLRTALAAYYDGPGRDATIRIHLPKGGYVPTFEQISGKQDAAEPPPRGRSITLRRHALVVVAVVAALLVAAAAGAFWFQTSPTASREPLLIVDPVAVASDDPVRVQMALGLSQSLVVALTRFQGLRVV